MKILLQLFFIKPKLLLVRRESRELSVIINCVSLRTAEKMFLQGTVTRPHYLEREFVDCLKLAILKFLYPHYPKKNLYRNSKVESGCDVSVCVSGAESCQLVSSLSIASAICVKLCIPYLVIPCITLITLCICCGQHVWCKEENTKE